MSNIITRRGFLKGIATLGLVVATPKIIFDLGKNLCRCPHDYKWLCGECCGLPVEIPGEWKTFETCIGESVDGLTQYGQTAQYRRIGDTLEFRSIGSMKPYTNVILTLPEDRNKFFNKRVIVNGEYEI